MGDELKKNILRHAFYKTYDHVMGDTKIGQILLPLMDNFCSKNQTRNDRGTSQRSFGLNFRLQNVS